MQLRQLLHRGGIGRCVGRCVGSGAFFLAHVAREVNGRRHFPRVPAQRAIDGQTAKEDCRRTAERRLQRNPLVFRERAPRRSKHSVDDGVHLAAHHATDPLNRHPTLLEARGAAVAVGACVGAVRHIVWKTRDNDANVAWYVLGRRQPAHLGA